MRKNQASTVNSGSQCFTFASLFTAFMLVLVFQSVAFAGDFNGKGRYEDWQKANVVYNEGNDLLKAKKYDEAAAKFKAAVALYDLDAEFHNNLGVALIRQGLVDPAEAEFRKAISLDPNVWDMWNNLGRVLFRKHQYADAKQAFAKALTLNPPAEERGNIEKNVTTANNKLSTQVSDPKGK